MTQKKISHPPLNTTSHLLANKIVRFLFREIDGFPFNPLEVLKFLSAFAIVQNRAILDGFFNALVEKISNLQSEDLPNETKEAILYSSLSYLAFSDPKNEAKITIKDIEYSIERIPLTSGWFSGTYYAYGLKTATENEPSYLIFKGTTFPTDGGFLVGLLADTRPHGAVGTQLYERGQKILQEWINKEKDRTHKNVICTGQSLGAAMSLHCHIHQPDKVDFYAINPPSLTSREKRVYESHAQNDIIGINRILKVLYNVNDLIFKVGSQYLPKNTQLIAHGDAKDSAFFAHAKAPACYKESLKLLPKAYDNTGVKRTPINVLWKMVKPILFIFALLCHMIALPMRLMTQIIHKISELYSKEAVSQTDSSTRSILDHIDSKSLVIKADQKINLIVYSNPFYNFQNTKPTDQVVSPGIREPLTIS